MKHPLWGLAQRLVAVLFILLLWPLPSLGEGAQNPYPQAEARPQTVRVRLNRLQITNRMDIVLDGVYSLGNQGETSMIFARGSQLTVLLQGGSMRVHYQGMSFGAGASLYLQRYQAKEGEENGIRLVGQPALYEGDLLLEVDGEVIRPTLYIHVEDYLLGVVPYEMSNDFPLEALKAQAVTARTYALRKQDLTKAYDLVDTTADQVYKGRVEGYDQAAQAVVETQGLCGFYKGRLAHCFYGASNGGQTALPQDVWGGSGEEYGYYAITDDPYDLENPLSLVKTFTLQKKPGQDEVVAYGLRKLLATALSKDLTKAGYDPTPESLRVDEVLEVALGEPAHGKESRVMTQLTLTFRYSARSRSEGDLPKGGEALAQADAGAESVQPQATPAATAPDGDSDVSLFRNATSDPDASNNVNTRDEALSTPEPVYGPFQAVDKPATITWPVFAKDTGEQGAIQALSLALNGASGGEVVTLQDGKNAYVLEARRYGHGVGMSQRGAEWMAAAYQKTFMDILAFYYPGMEVRQYAEGERALPVLNPEALQTPGPPPTATPRPTLMPITTQLPQGAWYATVTEIDDDSTLNLRAAPDLSGEVLMRLFKHQRLMVLERCPEEGWVKVKTDAVEGYVMESYLTKE